MKFGLILPSYLPEATVELMRESASLAEELGYDSVWTTDHIMVHRTSTLPYHSIFEPLTTLAWLAGITTKVKIGVSVVIVAMRHPVLVAKEVATIDRISGGRVILGVGTGHHEPEFEYLNADFHKRGQILDESLLLMRQLWTEPEKAFRGRFFRFENQSFGPPPVQVGGPPIWVGGLSERALKRAATYGDAWHGSRVPLDQFKAAAETIREANPSRKLTLTLRMAITAAGSRLSMQGSQTDVRDDIRRYEEAGCSHMAVVLWEGEPKAYVENVRRFAGEVMGKR